MIHFFYWIIHKREYNSERRRKQDNASQKLTESEFIIRENITPRGDGNQLGNNNRYVYQYHIRENITPRGDGNL